MTAVNKSLLPQGFPIWLAATLAGLCAARIFILFATPLNLGPDEAQYWSWSLKPDFGYFSKPPLIAWIIGTSAYFCGDAEACIRLPSPILHTAACVIMFLAARALYDERAAVLAALAYVFMPGTSFSSLLITTDVPLLLCWATALWALAELRKTPRLGWATVLGASVGLGLLAKYAMAYFFMGVAIAMLIDRPTRHALVSYAGLLALAIAGLTILPNIIWNLENSFATVRHTASNANWGAGMKLNIAGAANFLAAQYGILGPVGAVALTFFAVKAARKRELSQIDKILLGFSLPILAIVLAQSFIARANANWAAPAFVALTLLLSGFAGRYISTKLLTIHNMINGLLALCLGVLAVSPVAVAFVGQENSVKRLRGWPEAGQSIVSIASSGTFSAIVSDDREDMASLFYYTRHRTTPLRMWPTQTPGNEYESSYALTRADAKHVLLVTRKTDVSAITRTFTNVEKIGRVETRLDSKRTRIFYLYALRDLRTASNFPEF